MCWRVSGLTYTLRPSSLEPPPAGHMCALRCPLGAAHPPCPANCTRPNKRPCHGHAASPPGPATVQILHPTPSIDAVEFPRFFAPCWTAALSEGTELLSPDLLRFSGCGHFCIVATSPVPAPGDSPASLPLTLHSVRLSDGTRVGSYHIPDAAAPLSPRSVQVCDSHAVVLTRGECDGMWVVRVCDDGSLEPRHHIGPECHPDDAVLLRGVADDEAAFQQRVHDALTASTRGAAEAAGTTQATGHEERQGSGVALPGEAGFSRGRVMEAVFEGGRGCLSGLAQKMMTWMTRWHWGQDG